MQKKKLKGFTLVEMIMVLALFAIVMYSVLQLMDPVSKYFVRSSNFEGTTACVDNMKRAIEGNLKYANRVFAYSGYCPYDVAADDETEEEGETKSVDVSPTVSADLQAHVENFYEYYFANRKATDSAGYIYALVLDNTRVAADPSSGVITSYSDVKSLTEDKKNGGRIMLYKFWYNNYDEYYRNNATHVARSAEIGYGSSEAEETDYGGKNVTWIPDGVGTPSPGIQEWYVNQKLYGNYDFRFDLGEVTQKMVKNAEGEWIPAVDEEGNPIMVGLSEGAYDTNETEDGSTVSKAWSYDPADFSITISLYELRNNKEGDGVLRISALQNAITSFSMKNVLDFSTKDTVTPQFDILLSGNEVDEEGEFFQYNSAKRARYQKMQKNGGAASFDGMYFIFTRPETCYTNAAYIEHQSGYSNASPAPVPSPAPGT